MGGTQEDYDSWNKQRDLSDDLNMVKFAVYSSGYWNCVQYDRNALYRNVCNSVSKSLDTLGIKHGEATEIEMGGGGLLTLKEIFQTLMETKEIFEFVVSILGLIKFFFVRIIKYQTETRFPEFQIDLWIDSNKEVAKIKRIDLLDEISNRASNLLCIAHAIHHQLRDEYKIIKFNTSIKIQLNSINYKVDFSINDRFSSNFNLRRMIKMTDGVIIRQNYSYYYAFTNVFSIRRSEWKSIETDKATINTSYPDNYFYYSVNTIYDYFNNKAF